MADTPIDIKKEEVEEIKAEEVETAEVEIPDMTLLDIIDGENERKIPAAKFIDDIGQFSASFKPPASAELLIGAFSELHNKYKTFEATLTRKRKYPTLRPLHNSSMHGNRHFASMLLTTAHRV
jgi:hypothetical protein